MGSEALGGYIPQDELKQPLLTPEAADAALQETEDRLRADAVEAIEEEDTREERAAAELAKDMEAAGVTPVSEEELENIEAVGDIADKMAEFPGVERLPL